MLTSLLVAVSMLLSTQTQEKPNVLWLVCEDAGVEWIGCYGSREASTPNIDAFAKQGFRYTNAFAVAPVCAPSRSTWITGVNAIALGTLPMRSRYPIPHDIIKYYPDYLRKAGYLTSNHSKTDYNIGARPDNDCWDSSKPNAWELRKPGQPFFQVINFNQSHESNAHGSVENTRHSPENVTVKRYHPDLPGVRKTYAKYYDAVETMDGLVGKTLKDLEEAGLADQTIVIFNSDHGGVLPRSKRFLYDSGTHAPLIIRIPERFKDLWPAKNPGSEVDRLVSFLDMPKTWLSITRSEIPPIMQGRIFLGPDAEQEPEYVFSYRERMDERIDNSRAVRDKRFVYIKNYMSYVPNGQHLNYLWLMNATRVWEEAYLQGKTDAVTGRFFEPKPVEELYDMKADPDNVINLATNPEYRQTLETMRSKLREWQVKTVDTAMVPEYERNERATIYGKTIFEMSRDRQLFPIDSYLEAADTALVGDPAKTAQLLANLKSNDSAIRYWGTVGLLILGKPKLDVSDALLPLLKDPCGEVSAMSAWVLMGTEHAKPAHESLITSLKNHSPSSLLILNILDWSKTDLIPYIDAFDSLPTEGSADSNVGYEQRMVEYLRESRRLPAPVGKPQTPAKKKVATKK